MNRLFRGLISVVIGTLPLVVMAGCRSQSATAADAAEVPELEDRASDVAHQGPATIDEESGSSKPSPEKLQSELDRVNLSPPIFEKGQAPVQGPAEGTQTGSPSAPPLQTE